MRLGRAFLRTGLGAGLGPVAAIIVLTLALSTPPTWGLAQEKAPAPPAAAEPAAPPQPDQVLRRMSDFLTSLPQFSFNAEVTDDRVYRGGKKLQFAFGLEYWVKRPNLLRVTAVGDQENKEFFFDGKTLTLYDKPANAFGVLEMPGTIDEALAKAHQEYDIRVSLADLACTDLYALATKGVKSSLYVGLHRVHGVLCHHLAFDRDDTHWQLWIDTGDKPLLRKIVITQKRLPHSPQWAALLSDWNLSPQLADSLFAFKPPTGAVKIPFLSLKEVAAAKAKSVKPKKQKKGDKP